MMAMLTPEITATFTYMDDQLSMAAPDNLLFVQLNIASPLIVENGIWNKALRTRNVELENYADFHLRGQYSIP